MNRRARQSLIGATVTALAVSVGAVGVTLAGNPAAPVATSGEEAPGALGAHLEQLKRAVPGDAGMAEEGPGAAAQAAFEARAYPAETISLDKVEASRAEYRQAQARTQRLPRGVRSDGSWQPVGPSRALYPLTEFRNSGNYVPNQYVAGGRTTDVAIADRCKPGDCRMYITPAGGGVWRTDDAMAGQVSWTYLGGPLGINAAGSVTIDPTDRSGRTIYVGTGEANICGSGCVAGVGMYKSNDGGETWQGPLGKDVLSGKGIGDIVIDPRDGRTIYAATTTALRGHSSVCCSGVTRPVPGAAQWGLYKSTDGGQSWNFIHNGSVDESQCLGTIEEFNNRAICSPRGVRHVELDPVNPDVVYAGSYARGIWRSNDGGDTWVQIKESLNRTQLTSRPAFDVTRLPNGNTRMYVHEGNFGVPYSRLFRSDDVRAGVPVFADLTSANPADDGYATYNQCGGQCWYDLFVYTPPGHPDVVYTGGSYGYRETRRISNGRAVVLSTDAGASGTDMTMDGTDAVHPNALHPDQHNIVTHPDNPFLFFEVNDGGVMRSTGEFVDRSEWCDSRTFLGAVPAEIQRDRCRQLLSRIPERLIGMNNGLSTLQFQSLSVSPFNPRLLQGGTQDNGTWQSEGNPVQWVNTMIGDGGQSGFDVEVPEFRFHNFFNATTEVNFDSGDIGDWIWTADPIFGHVGTQFYAPVISDPVVSGTLFAGTGRTVYRTTTFGLGDRSLEEANRICNTWTGTFEERCGDWAETGPNRLTSAFWGDRAGGAVAAVERSAGNRSTAWAATTTGRVFVSTNIDAEDPAAITWRRLDTDTTVDPNRFVSSIYVSPEDPNVAWVSYSGYSQSTPATPGHVFKVTATGAGSTWENLSGDLQDLPITDLVRDDVTGDLYASTDFGVLRRPAGTTTWVVAAPGLPNVEVAGLTIVPEERILYAASHGLSAWRLNL
ncbi:MAG: exo-alpha-sialidase [Actinomycetota bacterium]|nr:exo-alpha-sialidase [Actinomycetota bacterium]